MSTDLDPEEIVTIRCVVASIDAGGFPAFFPVKVSCRRRHYDDGDHYDAARQEAEDHGYEYENSRVVFDENDGPAWLFSHFEWGAAAEVSWDDAEDEDEEGDADDANPEGQKRPHLGDELEGPVCYQCGTPVAMTDLDHGCWEYDCDTCRHTVTVVETDDQTNTYIRQIDPWPEEDDDDEDRDIDLNVTAFPRCWVCKSELVNGLCPGCQPIT